MRIKRFNEANINLSELDRDSKIIKGISNGDYLIKKFKSEDDLTPYVSFKPIGGKKSGKFKVVNTEEIINSITKDGEYDKSLAKDFFKTKNRYNDIIIADVDGKETKYKLNDIEKTVEFGSGRGTSLGTTETKIVETIQSLYILVLQKKVLQGKYELTHDDIINCFDLNGKLINNYRGRIRSSVEITLDLVESYKKSWGASFIKVAKGIFIGDVLTKSKVDVLRKSNYLIYHNAFDKGISGEILKKYRSFKITTGIPISKWNPSDIWLVYGAKENSIKTDIEKSRDIDSLNYVIEKYFRSGDLIGISLKKTKIKDVKLVINKETTRPKFEYIGYKTSVDPYDSISTYLYVNQISDIEFLNNVKLSIQIRSFSGSKISDVMGEITGHSSRHGKIGLGKINSIISGVLSDVDVEFILGKTVPTRSEMLNNPEQYTEEKLKKLILNLNEYLEPKTKVSKESKKRSISHLISKFQSLYLVCIIKKLEDLDKLELANKICENIFYYALSINTGRFDSSMYLRII